MIIFSPFFENDGRNAIAIMDEDNSNAEYGSFLWANDRQRTSSYSTATGSFSFQRRYQLKTPSIARQRKIMNSIAMSFTPLTEYRPMLVISTVTHNTQVSNMRRARRIVARMLE